MTREYSRLKNSLTREVSRIEIADDPMNNGGSEISAFCTDDRGNIFAATELNLYKYDFKKNKFMATLSTTRMANTFTPVFLVFNSAKNGLWLVRERDIALIDIQTKKCKEPFAGITKGTAGIPENHNISAIYMDGEQNMWLSDYNRILYQYWKNHVSCPP